MGWWWSFEIIYQTLDARIGIKELLVVLLIIHFINFLSVITKIRNEPKQPETSPNDQKNCETTQNFNIREIWNFLLAFFFQTLNPNAKFGYFGERSIKLFNLLTKFCLYFILKMLIWNLTLFFESFKPKCLYLGILGQKVSCF